MISERMGPLSRLINSLKFCVWGGKDSKCAAHDSERAAREQVSANYTGHAAVDSTGIQPAGFGGLPQRSHVRGGVGFYLS